VAESPDLFARRNRARIALMLVLATINYMVAIALATVAVVLTIILGLFLEGGDIPGDLDVLKFLGIAIGGIAAVSAVVGAVIGLVRIPFQRRRLERRVLKETGAHIAGPDEHPRVRNLLEGLAIAAGVVVPRFAIIDDAAANAFGVGTRPSNTVIGVTTGLQQKLSRDELEAVLAFEVSRIRSWDVALASWTVALTSGAIAASESSGDDGFLKSVLGYLPKRFGEWLQVWALRDQGVERDRAAIRFTRNPASLIRALQKLDEDPTPLAGVSRATAPLWVEFPAQVLTGSSSRGTQRLARELLLDERIEELHRLARLPRDDEQATVPSDA
jgi:heat shock protein HtpX